MKLLGKIIFAIIIFTVTNSYSQDPYFSQFYSNPLSLNPAFAGSAGCSRVVLNYRLQWPKLSGNYKTFSASYDQYSNSVKGGLGFSYMYDASGDILFSHYANVFYSYNIKCSENFIVKPAVNIGFGRKSIDESKLFGPLYLPNNPRYYFNVGAGALFIYKNLIGGFAFDHINEPNESFFDSLGSAKLPMKFTAHVSCQFDIKDKLKITPVVIYLQQQNFKAIIPSVLFNVWYIKFGVGLRTGFNNPDSFISMIGFQNNKFSIGYSYDYVISKLSNATGGSHEISAVFKFNCKNKTDKFIVPQLNGF